MKLIRGFSLLEMIGVMAVMAILAGALAPSVFQLIEEGYQTAEQQSLAAISDSLARAIRRDKRVPTATITDWTDLVADYASIPPNRVSTNDKNFARRLYVDPMFFTSSNQTFSGYTQTQGLNSMPFSPRIMIVSNLQGNVTTNLNSNTRFSDVWDQTSDATIVESDDVLIERINLAPIFVRLVLNNANAAQAGYSLESGSEAAIAAASGGVDGSRTVYVIDSTRITLNAVPYPGGASQRQVIVNAEDSIRYQLQGSAWAWVN